MPYSDQPPGSYVSVPTHTANFFKDDGTSNEYDDGYAVTGSTTYTRTQNYLTDVGAYTSAPSPYGTFDQGGNVWEWNESVKSPIARCFRGGAWGYSSGDVDPRNTNVFQLEASYWNEGNPTTTDSAIGFRLAAAIPEPTTTLLLFFGASGISLRGWCRRRAKLFSLVASASCRGSVRFRPTKCSQRARFDT